MRRLGLVCLLLLLLATSLTHAQTRKTASAAAPLFTTHLTLDQMAHKQAVVETTRGTFVIALLPEVAPNHVGYFIKLAQEGAYVGTTFHRAVRLGIIQGGDPISKDSARQALVGTGGFDALKAEFNATPVGRGAVAAVLQPGRPDSAGAQFFIAVSDQRALNGQFTVYGQVVEGLEVVQQISEAAADAQGRLTDRIEITRVTIRDAPPAEAIPFSTETVEELARYRAVLETSLGEVTIALVRTRRPSTSATFFALPRQACTTAPRSIAWSTASSSRPAWSRRAACR